MSELFQPINPEATLRRIQELLDQGMAAAVVVEEMLPISEKKQPAPTMRGDADRLAITSARDD